MACAFTADLKPIASALGNIHRITRGGKAKTAANLRLETLGDAVWFSAGTIACSLHERVPATVGQWGEVIVQSGILETALRDMTISDGTVKATYSEAKSRFTNPLELRCTDGEWRTSRKPRLGESWAFDGCQRPADFDGLPWVPLGSGFMRSMSLVRFAVNDIFDPNRAWSSGVRLSVSEGGEVSLTGASGRRIAHTTYELESGGSDASPSVEVVLDGESLSLVSKSFQYEAGVEVARMPGRKASVAIRQVHSDGRTTHVVINELEESYPDLSRTIVPPELGCSIQMPLESLQMPLAIARSLLGSDARCILEPRDDGLFMTAGGGGCEMEYHLDIAAGAVIGTDPIGFSVRYLWDPLRAIAAACEVHKERDPVVHLRWVSCRQPAFLECPDLPWVLQVIGPMDPAATREAAA
jgi:hypothetical protein